MKKKRNATGNVAGLSGKHIDVHLLYEFEFCFAWLSSALRNHIFMKISLLVQRTPKIIMIVFVDIKFDWILSSASLLFQHVYSTSHASYNSLEILNAFCFGILLKLYLCLKRQMQTKWKCVGCISLCWIHYIPVKNKTLLINFLYIIKQLNL